MEFNKRNIDKVLALTAKYRNNEDFPKYKDFGFTEEEFDNYIYTMSNVGTIENLKKQYTIYGIAVVVPIAASSLFFPPNKALFIGLPIGAILAGLVYLFYYLKNKKTKKQYAKMDIEGYINAILNYNNQ